MKRNSSTRSAFFLPRVLVGFSLILVSLVLALLAFGLTPIDDSNSQTDNSSGWFDHFVSALGVDLNWQKLAALEAPRGGGAPISKPSGEPAQRTAQSATAAAYAGPRNDQRPVESVRTP